MIQTLEVISLNLWQVIISLIDLLIIFLLLKKFLYKPVKKLLAKREAQVNSIYSKAEAARAAAEADKATYHEKLSYAQEEAKDIIKSAQASATRISNTLISDANEEVAAMRQKAEADIALEKQKATNEVKTLISDLSLNIAEKMLGREINSDDQSALIDQFIKDIGDGND
ncbi:MAG: F0F1 ATP synthase subunit B [Oscillospiraceae bacterium]|nr:F0F1 ATP synthase subunit B [Oscillospiraceae bacterium]